MGSVVDFLDPRQRKIRRIIKALGIKDKAVGKYIKEHLMTFDLSEINIKQIKKERMLGDKNVLENGLSGFYDKKRGIGEKHNKKILKEEDLFNYNGRLSVCPDGKIQIVYASGIEELYSSKNAMSTIDVFDIEGRGVCRNSARINVVDNEQFGYAVSLKEETQIGRITSDGKYSMLKTIDKGTEISNAKDKTNPTTILEMMEFADKTYEEPNANIEMEA